MKTARDWLDSILDPGWAEQDGVLASGDPLRFPGYAPERETVLAASGSLAGFPVEAISFEFAVLGGSMGVVAGERIARAFERAVGRRAAVVALCASGGARMQEGMLALSQMAKTIVARLALASEGLPFVAYLRHPTTGGVYASFGSLADVVWAEPHATIGFAGPRVAATVTGKPLPPGSHTAESALAHGAIDEILQPDSLKASLRATLELLMSPDVSVHGDSAPEPEPSRTGWDAVQAARDPARPTAADLLYLLAPHRVALRGDRARSDDSSVTCAIARIAGRKVMTIALDRTHPGPAGYRKARRAIATASSLRLPLITLIDTPGADPSAESESEGLAYEIASTFEAMLAHPWPTVALVTGEGGSGGALAFATADRLLVLENAIFSVIAPEAAATILKRDDVSNVAAELQLTAHDLRRFGIADRVVSESPSGSSFDDAAVEFIAREIGLALAGIDATHTRERRSARWRAAGNAWVGE